MPWVVDIIIIVVLAICALIGLKKGLYKSLTSLFGNFLSIVVAFFLTRVVTLAVLEIDTVNKWVFGDPSLYTWVSGWSSNITDGFLGGVVSSLLTPITAVVDAGTITQAQGVALYLSYLITSAIVMLILFLLIKIVMAIVFKIIGSIINRESPGALSRLLGFIVGAVKGGLYVVIVFLLANYLLTFPIFNFVGDAINESTIGKPVYEQVQKVSDTILAGTESETDVIDKLIELSGITAAQA